MHRTPILALLHIGKLPVIAILLLAAAFILLGRSISDDLKEGKSTLRITQGKGIAMTIIFVTMVLLLMAAYEGLP